MINVLNKKIYIILKYLRVINKKYGLKSAALSSHPFTFSGASGRYVGFAK